MYVFQIVQINRYCIYKKYVYLLTRDVGAEGGGGLWGSSTLSLKPGGLSTPNFIHGTKSASKFIRKFVEFFPQKRQQGCISGDIADQYCIYSKSA